MMPCWESERCVGGLCAVQRQAEAEAEARITRSEETRRSDWRGVCPFNEQLTLFVHSVHVCVGSKTCMSN